MYTYFLIYSLKSPVIIDCMTGRDDIKTNHQKELQFKQI